jgi:hypothetical protein
MSDTPRRDEAQQATGRSSNPADPRIADLPEKMKEDEADNVRGGLNPQPLPPKPKPPI